MKANVKKMLINSFNKGLNPIAIFAVIIFIASIIYMDIADWILSSSDGSYNQWAYSRDSNTDTGPDTKTEEPKISSRKWRNYMYAVAM